MTPADKREFAEIITGFAELKSKQLSKAALTLYWNAMQHWSIEDFRAAANQLIRTCEFMPTPKDFEDLRKAGRPTAGEAWAQVLDYVRKGYYQWIGGGVSLNAQAAPPQDPHIERAVRAIGGYQAIAMSDVDKTHFLERRFCEHYEEMRDAVEVREAVPMLAHESRPRIDGPRKLLE